MGRVGERIQNKVKGFKITPVYSAFLLNVKETVEKGALFPCKPIWEDIEFSYILEQVGLKTLKCQRLYHAKPFNRSIRSKPDISTFAWSEDTFLKRAGVNEEPTNLPTLEEFIQWIETQYPESDHDIGINVIGAGNPESEFCDSKISMRDSKYFVDGKKSINRIFVPNENREKLLCLQDLAYWFRDKRKLGVDVTAIVFFGALALNSPGDVCMAETFKDWSTGPLVPLLKNLFVNVDISSNLPIIDNVVSSACDFVDGSALIIKVWKENEVPIPQPSGAGSENNQFPKTRMFFQ